MRPAIASSIVLLLCFAYAVARYVVFGEVSPDHLGVFIMNKALSLAGLLLIALAVGARPISRVLPAAGWLREDRRAIGMAGLGYAGIHTVLSLMLLGPGYFAKFYDTQSGLMTAAAEWSMLAGAVALALLIWQSRINGGAQGNASAQRRWLGTGVLALALAHVGFMGWPGWWTPNTWPGGLPPITLLSAAVALLGVALGLLPRRG